MKLVDGLMAVAVGVDLVSNYLQIRHNKSKHSVYGLSYDYILFSTVSCITEIISSGFYQFNTHVHNNYRFRFPIHPEINVNSLILILNAFNLIVVSALFWQIKFIYHRTRSTDQGFSTLAKGILAIAAVILVWVVTMCTSQNSISTLDLVDYIWLVSQIAATVRLIPQVQTNLFGECVVGLHDQYIKLQSVSVLALFIGKVRLSADYKWYDIPVNFRSWPNLIVSMMCIVIILVQKEWLFRGNSPSLDVVSTV